MPHLKYVSNIKHVLIRFPVHIAPHNNTMFPITSTFSVTVSVFQMCPGLQHLNIGQVPKVNAHSLTVMTSQLKCLISLNLTGLQAVSLKFDFCMINKLLSTKVLPGDLNVLSASVFTVTGH